MWSSRLAFVREKTFMPSTHESLSLSSTRYASILAPVSVTTSWSWSKFMKHQDDYDGNACCASSSCWMLHLSPSNCKWVDWKIRLPLIANHLLITAGSGRKQMSWASVRLCILSFSSQISFTMWMCAAYHFKFVRTADWWCMISCTICSIPILLHDCTGPHLLYRKEVNDTQTHTSFCDFMRVKVWFWKRMMTVCEMMWICAIHMQDWNEIRSRAAAVKQVSHQDAESWLRVIILFYF